MMNLVHKIENWGDTHHPIIWDAVRIALGIFLFMKGMAFMENTGDLRSIIEAQDNIIFPPSAIMGLVYYVIFAHMVGGIMITLGILTRFSSVIQIPIVLGAIFVNDSLLSPINTQLWYSVVALALLVIFIIIGSGPLSLDKYFGNIPAEEE